MNTDPIIPEGDDQPFNNVAISSMASQAKADYGFGAFSPELRQQRQRIRTGVEAPLERSMLGNVATGVKASLTDMVTGTANTIDSIGLGLGETSARLRSEREFSGEMAPPESGAGRIGYLVGSGIPDALSMVAAGNVGGLVARGAKIAGDLVRYNKLRKMGSIAFLQTEYALRGYGNRQKQLYEDMETSGGTPDVPMSHLGAAIGTAINGWTELLGPERALLLSGDAVKAVMRVAAKPGVESTAIKLVSKAATSSTMSGRLKSFAKGGSKVLFEEAVFEQTLQRVGDELINSTFSRQKPSLIGLGGEMVDTLWATIPAALLAGGSEAIRRNRYAEMKKLWLVEPTKESVVEAFKINGVHNQQAAVDFEKNIQSLREAMGKSAILDKDAVEASVAAIKNVAINAARNDPNHTPNDLIKTLSVAFAEGGVDFAELGRRWKKAVAFVGGKTRSGAVDDVVLDYLTEVVPEFRDKVYEIQNMTEARDVKDENAKNAQAIKNITPEYAGERDADEKKFGDIISGALGAGKVADGTLLPASALKSLPDAAKKFLAVVRSGVIELDGISGKEKFDVVIHIDGSVSINSHEVTVDEQRQTEYIAARERLGLDKKDSASVKELRKQQSNYMTIRDHTGNLDEVDEVIRAIESSEAAPTAGVEARESRLEEVGRERMQAARAVNELQPIQQRTVIDTAERAKQIVEQIAGRKKTSTVPQDTSPLPPEILTEAGRHRMQVMADRLSRRVKAPEKTAPVSKETFSGVDSMVERAKQASDKADKALAEGDQRRATAFERQAQALAKIADGMRNRLYEEGKPRVLKSLSDLPDADFLDIAAGDIATAYELEQDPFLQADMLTDLVDKVADARAKIDNQRERQDVKDAAIRKVVDLVDRAEEIRKQRNAQVTASGEGVRLESQRRKTMATTSANLTVANQLRQATGQRPLYATAQKAAEAAAEEATPTIQAEDTQVALYLPERKMAVFFEGATPKEVLHEYLHHIIENSLVPATIWDAMVKAYGDNGKDWSNKASERFVENFLEHLSGKMPVGANAEAMLYMKGIMSHVAEEQYRYMNDATRAAFDSMLGIGDNTENMAQIGRAVANSMKSSFKEAQATEQPLMAHKQGELFNDLTPDEEQDRADARRQFEDAARNIKRAANNALVGVQRASDVQLRTQESFVAGLPGADDIEFFDINRARNIMGEFLDTIVKKRNVSREIVNNFKTSLLRAVDAAQRHNSRDKEDSAPLYAKRPIKDLYSVGSKKLKWDINPSEYTTAKNGKPIVFWVGMHNRNLTGVEPEKMPFGLVLVQNPGWRESAAVMNSFIGDTRLFPKIAHISEVKSYPFFAKTEAPYAANIIERGWWEARDVDNIQMVVERARRNGYDSVIWAVHTDGTAFEMSIITGGKTLTAIDFDRSRVNMYPESTEERMKLSQVKPTVYRGVWGPAINSLHLGGARPYVWWTISPEYAKNFTREFTAAARIIFGKVDIRNPIDFRHRDDPALADVFTVEQFLEEVAMRIGGFTDDQERKALRKALYDITGEAYGEVLASRIAPLAIEPWHFFRMDRHGSMRDVLLKHGFDGALVDEGDADHQIGIITFNEEQYIPPFENDLDEAMEGLKPMFATRRKTDERLSNILSEKDTATRRKLLRQLLVARYGGGDIGRRLARQAVGGKLHDATTEKLIEAVRTAKYRGASKETTDKLSMHSFGKPFADLNADQKAMIRRRINTEMRINTSSPSLNIPKERVAAAKEIAAALDAQPRSYSVRANAYGGNAAYGAYLNFANRQIQKLKNWRASNLAKFIDQKFTDFYYLLDIIADGKRDHPIFKTFYEPWRDMLINFTSERQKTTKWWDENGKFVNDIDFTRRVMLNGKDYKLSEAMAIYLMTGGNAQSQEANTLFRSRADLSDGPNKTPASDTAGRRKNFDQMMRDVAALVNSEAELKNFVKFSQKFFDAFYDRINVVYRRINKNADGTPKDMPRRLVYFPMVHEGGAFMQEDHQSFLQNVVVPAKRMTAQPLPRSLERTGNVGSKVRLDTVGGMITYMRQAENYIAKAEIIQQLSDVARSPQLVASIRDMFGGSDDYNQALQAFIEREQYPSGRISPLGSGETPMRWMRLAFSRGALAGNIPSVIRQTISIYNGMGEVPWSHWGTIGHTFFDSLLRAGRGGFLTGKYFEGNEAWATAKRMNAPFVLSMLEGGSAELETEYYRNDFFGDNKVGRWIADKMLAPQRTVDQAAKLSVWWGAYKYKFDRISAGLDKGTAEKIAARWANDVLAKTQPSALVGEKNLVQTENEWWKAMLLFTSQNMKNFQYFRREVAAPLYRGWKDGGIEGAWHALTSKNDAHGTSVLQKFALGTFAPAVALGTIARGRPPKTLKEFFEDMMVYNLVNAPVLGPLLVGAIMYESYGSSGNVLPVWADALGAVQDSLGNAWKSAKDGEVTEDEFGRTLDSILYGTRYFGMPAVLKKYYTESGKILSGHYEKLGISNGAAAINRLILSVPKDQFETDYGSAWVNYQKQRRKEQRQRAAERKKKAQ